MSLKARIIFGVFLSILNLITIILSCLLMKNINTADIYTLLCINITNLLLYVISMLKLFAPVKLMKFHYGYDKFTHSTFKGYDISRNVLYAFLFKFRGLIYVGFNVFFSLCVIILYLII